MNLMSYKIIHTFNDVVLPIHQQPFLLVLDIDETILTIDQINDQWFNNKIHDYRHFQNPEIIQDLILNDWVNHVQNYQPKHTDKKGLMDLIDRCTMYQGTIHFLTARNTQLKEITRQQLNFLKIPQAEIEFCQGGNKGKILKELLKKKYQLEKRPIGRFTILFIDDRDKYLDQVKTELRDMNVDLHLYQFIHYIK